MAVHGGLEVGFISEKYPHMDFIAVGPHSKDLHSPDERVNISSVKDFWGLFKEVIENIF